VAVRNGNPFTKTQLELFRNSAAIHQRHMQTQIHKLNHYYGQLKMWTHWAVVNKV